MYKIGNNQLCMLRIKNYLFLRKNVLIFEFYEQYLEKVYSKLNLAQSTRNPEKVYFQHEISYLFNPLMLDFFGRFSGHSLR